MSRQVCIKCKTIPTDILILQCNHGLCIECSAIICNRKSHHIQCVQCQYQTYLQPEIYQQVLENSGLYKHRSSLSSVTKEKYGYQPVNYSHKGSNSCSTQPSLKISRKNSKNEKNIVEQISTLHKQKHFQSNSFPENACQQHPQYEIMYICLQCDNIFVCPQCIIHGVHKDHGVETIKKTISKIQVELSSKIYSLDCSIEGLVLASQQEKQKLKKKIQQINKLKQQAIEKYKHIRQEIDREQGEILQECANLIDSYEKDYHSIQNWIKKDLHSIQKEKDVIYKILNPVENIQSNAAIKKKQNNQRCSLSAKENVRDIEIKIVQVYFNHLKTSQMNRDSSVWKNSKNLQIDSYHQENEESLEVLTDRVQRIPSLHLNINNLQTKTPCLAASRNQLRTKKSFQCKVSNDTKSPFRGLKNSHHKQNISIEKTQISSTTNKMKESRKLFKKQVLRKNKQNNFPLF